MTVTCNDLTPPPFLRDFSKSHFVVLDELETIKDEIDNREFTEGVMEIIGNLEETAGHNFNLDRAWSDNSSFSFRASGGNYPYLEVHNASDERIYLQAVPKPRDSVRTRVSLLKQLLKQDRIRISANCKAVRRMLKNLKKGTNVLDYVVRDDNKHVFDALTYALLMEMSEELELGAGKASTGQRVGLAVSIGR